MTLATHHSLLAARAAVLGHPISHSLSPALHGYWLKRHGINGSYEAIETPAEALAETLKKLADAGYRGVNLTVPLKEAVMPLLDEIDPIAQQIGAVNTVVFAKGKMTGYNTDAYGFIQNLQSSHHPIIPSSAFIFGAGGAARAILAGLIEAGVEKIMICNRNKERAEELANLFSRHSRAGGNLEMDVCEWDRHQTHLPHYSLIINTTSLGMKNQFPLEVDFSNYPPETLVTDIVYNPLETPFLRNAQAANLPTVDGLGMLLYQGQKAFEYFFGILPEVTEALRLNLLKPNN